MRQLAAGCARHTGAGVANKQHVDVAADVHAAVADAREPPDEHQQQRQLHCKHAVQLQADAADDRVAPLQRRAGVVIPEALQQSSAKAVPPACWSGDGCICWDAGRFTAQTAALLSSLWACNPGAEVLLSYLSTATWKARASSGVTSTQPLRSLRMATWLACSTSAVWQRAPGTGGFHCRSTTAVTLTSSAAGEQRCSESAQPALRRCEPAARMARDVSAHRPAGSSRPGRRRGAQRWQRAWRPWPCSGSAPAAAPPGSPPKPSPLPASKMQMLCLTGTWSLGAADSVFGSAQPQKRAGSCAVGQSETEQWMQDTAGEANTSTPAQ